MIKGNLSNPGGAHLSETNFRRFEPHFQEFLLAYPSSLTLEPIDLATTTFAARMRDAANAFITKGFESKVDRNTFETMWSKSVVTTNDGKVIIGPKASVKEAIRAEVTASGTPQYLCELAPTELQLRALSLLYATQVFTLPSRITKLPAIVELSPGCVLDPQPDGSYLLL